MEGAERGISEDNNSSFALSQPQPFTYSERSLQLMQAEFLKISSRTKPSTGKGRVKNRSLENHPWPKTLSVRLPPQTVLDLTLEFLCVCVQGSAAVWSVLENLNTMLLQWPATGRSSGNCEWWTSGIILQINKVVVLEGLRHHEPYFCISLSVNKHYKGMYGHTENLNWSHHVTFNEIKVNHYFSLECFNIETERSTLQLCEDGLFARSNTFLSAWCPLER